MKMLKFDQYVQVVFLMFSCLLAVNAFADPTTPDPADPGPRAENNRAIWLFQGEALAGYSEVLDGSEGDFSTSNSWLTSLALTMSEQDQLIFVYNGAFQQSQLFITQDEGTRSSNQLMENNATVSWKHTAGPSLIIRPTFFYHVVNVKETDDEDLGDGLYDYEDIGGGIETTHVLDEESKRTFRSEFSMFLREYPNYQSLLSIFNPNGTAEVDEKNFTGYKWNGALSSNLTETLTGVVSVMTLYKDFTDKLTIDSNGIRESGNREDFYYEITGNLIQQVNDSVAVGFMSQYAQNISNLGFYDTRGTVGLADDRFFEEYFDYSQYRLSPTLYVDSQNIFYSEKQANWQFSYEYEQTHYPDRTIQDELGSYQSADQEDEQHGAFIRLDVPLTEYINWVSSASYIDANSNQKFEQTYVYSYETWSVLSGLSVEL